MSEPVEPAGLGNEPGTQLIGNHSLTYTGKAGPGKTITGATIGNLRRMEFDFGRGRLLILNDDHKGNVWSEYDLYPVTTVTVTVTNHQFEFVVS